MLLSFSAVILITLPDEAALAIKTAGEVVKVALALLKVSVVGFNALGAVIVYIFLFSYRNPTKARGIALLGLNAWIA